MKDNLKDVGIWGQRHYHYLKENKPSVIGVMRMNGNNNHYLAELWLRFFLQVCRIV